MHAEDVVVEYIITVPDYPRRIVGREALAELYSDYGESIVQTGSSDVYRYYDPERSVVVLEYTMHGTVVRTGAPYVNRFVSVITVKDRKNRALARLPGPVGGVGRIRQRAGALLT